MKKIILGMLMTTAIATTAFAAAEQRQASTTTLGYLGSNNLASVSFVLPTPSKSVKPASVVTKFLSTQGAEKITAQTDDLFSVKINGANKPVLCFALPATYASLPKPVIKVVCAASKALINVLKTDAMQIHPTMSLLDIDDETVAP